MRSVTSTRVHWDAVLGDLGRVLPTGVSLTSLTVATPTAAAAACRAPRRGSTFTDRRSTSSHVRVALILDRLALLPWLSGVALQSTTRSGNAVTFSINGDVRRRRWIVIDRMSGRVALLLVSGRADAGRPARLVRADLPAAVEGVEARLAGRRDERRAAAVTSLLARPDRPREPRGAAGFEDRGPRRPEDVADSPSVLGGRGAPRASRSTRSRPQAGCRDRRRRGAADDGERHGHYFAIQKFLRILRSEAVLRGDKMVATGRLYTVDSIQFTGSGARRRDGPAGASTGLVSGGTGSQRVRLRPDGGVDDGGCRRPPTRRPHAADALMSSAGVSRGKRPTAYAAAAAAKQRRQKIIAGGLGVVLIAVLAYEVPHLLKLVQRQERRAGRSPPHDAGGRCRRAARICSRRFGAAPAADPFAQLLPTNGDPTAATSPSRRGSVDPFAAQVVVESILDTDAHRRSSTQPVAGDDRDRHARRRPQGKPRLDRHPRLDPDGRGQGLGNDVSPRRRARRESAPVSVLNSSNRRPLRGGYWVVYTGPYATLNAVTTRAGSVHSQGYPTAYIRELIVYR